MSDSDSKLRQKERIEYFKVPLGWRSFITILITGASFCPAMEHTVQKLKLDMIGSY